MLKQVMTAPHVIEFHEVDKPTAGAGQVLLKIMKVGICGSDIHVYHGKHPFTSYPVTQGHELSAEVVALGEGVTRFHVGQKVTVEPQVYCNKCYPCTHGKYNLCESLKVMGFQTTGLAVPFAVVDESKATALPDSMSYDEGAMIEPLAVAVHAAGRFPITNGTKVAVIGAGPIGNLVAQSAKALGATVMITDISDYRLHKAADECGIQFAFNTINKNFGEAMIEAFGEEKADVIYDCAGNDITMGQAIRYARKGSTIILVAVYAGMANVDLAVLNDHELDLNTTMMYRHEDYVRAIELVEQGKVLLAPLMSKVFSFREYDNAYKFIDKNRETALKVLIDIQA